MGQPRVLQKRKSKRRINKVSGDVELSAEHCSRLRSSVRGALSREAVTATHRIHVTAR